MANLGGGPIPAIQKAYQAAPGYTFQKGTGGALFARVLPLAFTVAGTAALVTGLFGMYTGTGKRD